jgi:hypothetical protein
MVVSKKACKNGERDRLTCSSQNKSCGWFYSVIPGSVRLCYWNVSVAQMEQKVKLTNCRLLAVENAGGINRVL